MDIPGPGTYEDEQTLKAAIEKKVVNSNDKPRWGFKKNPKILFWIFFLNPKFYKEIQL